MGPSLPRILDDEKATQLPSQCLISKQLKKPKISLSDLFPAHKSRLLRFQYPRFKYSLPSRSYHSPFKRQPFRIAFHPQRVRRTNRKGIEKVLLPMLLSQKVNYSEQLLESFKSRPLPRRERRNINIEQAQPFCMFLSKLERKEFFVPSRSVLRQPAWSFSQERHVKPREVAPHRRAEDLVGFRELGFTGALPRPRLEGCIRDFLEARPLFREDDKRRERIEKEATEFKPRMTFTR